MRSAHKGKKDRREPVIADSISTAYLRRVNPKSGELHVGLPAEYKSPFQTGLESG